MLLATASCISFVRLFVRLILHGYNTDTVMNDKDDAMKAAPYHECPRGAMPQPAQQHSQHEVSIGSQAIASIPAKREIEVFAQPGR